MGENRSLWPEGMTVGIVPMASVYDGLNYDALLAARPICN